MPSTLSHIRVPLTRGQDTLMLAASATTDHGEAKIDGNAFEAAIYVVWGAGCSAGAVQIETADDIEYTGTWAPLGSAISWAAANKQDVLQVSGALGAIRARVSTTIVGGTVNVKIVTAHGA